MSLVFGLNGPVTLVGGLTGVSCHRTRPISASPAHAAWLPAPHHTSSSPNLRRMTPTCLRAEPHPGNWYASNKKFQLSTVKVLVRSFFFSEGADEGESAGTAVELQVQMKTR